MWWLYNSYVYLYKYMCSINYNLPGYIYCAGTTSCINNLSCKYQYFCLLNTSTGKFCFQCMVSYCIGKWRMQWCIDE